MADGETAGPAVQFLPRRALRRARASGAPCLSGWAQTARPPPRLSWRMPSWSLSMSEHLRHSSCIGSKSGC